MSTERKVGGWIVLLGSIFLMFSCLDHLDPTKESAAKDDGQVDVATADDHLGFEAESMCEDALDLHMNTDLMATTSDSSQETSPGSKVFEVQVYLNGPRDSAGNRTVIGSGECRVDMNSKRVLSSSKG